VDQQDPDHHVGDKLAHALSRPKAKPPKVVSVFESASLQKSFRSVLLGVGTPVLVALVQCVRIDNEVCAGGEVVPSNDSTRRCGLWHRKGRQWSETGGFRNACC